MVKSLESALWAFYRSNTFERGALLSANLGDDADPRFKINPSAQELNKLYTPTVYELAFARERARQPLQRAGLSLLLKTFQRLGYFALCAEIPAPIVRQVFRCAALVELPEQLQAYDASTARDRHTTLIREFLGVTAYGPAAREVAVETCLQAARTRDDLPDLINMAIEELFDDASSCLHLAPC